MNEWFLFFIAETYKSGRLISLTKAFKKHPFLISATEERKNRKTKKKKIGKKREDGVQTRKKVSYGCLGNKSFSVIRRHSKSF